jgi:membrane protease YdiL (CAAX protease family)
VLWATAFALAGAAGLIARPAIGPELLGGPAIGLALFVMLAGGRPRFPARRASVLAARGVYLVGGAAFEELIWRGIALALLTRPLGTFAALGLTSVLFALSHRRALGRPTVVHVATGAAFGVAFVWGGLASAILAHAVYNVLVDLGVQAQGLEWGSR